MTEAKITFGAFAPDNADHEGAMQAADGAYPSANGYRPIGAFSQITTALTGDFKGGAAFIATDGTIRMVAGDDTSLYSYVSNAWASRIEDLTVTTRWDFTQFGDDVVCCNGGAPIKYNVVADTAEVLAGSPPTAEFCTTVNTDFVLLGSTGGSNNVVTWSQQGDVEGWTAGVAMSGSQPIYDGGAIMGLAGGEYGLIIQRFQVVRMSFTGISSDPWQFDPISTNYGCLQSGSIAQAGRLVFFYSDRGFVVCDGTDVKPIGVERVDNTFRSEYSASELDAMYAAVDPVRTLVLWVLPDKMWIYNWSLDQWSTAALPITAVFDALTQPLSEAALIALYGDLDSVPFDLDDPFLAGGAPRAVFVHTDGRFGLLAGSNIAATFEPARMQLADGRVARIRFFRPTTDAISGLTLTLDSRQRLGDPASVETFTQIHASGDMPVRAAATALKATLGIAAATTWDFVQGGVFEFEVGGKR